MRVNIQDVKNNIYGKEFKIAYDVINILGGNSCIVGGAVRDIVLDRETNDVDIATDVPMSIIEDKFSTYDIGKNKDFGIVVVKHKGFDFEVAQFRADGIYGDNRHPNNIKLVNSFKEDSKRRDFSINAMAINTSGNIIDHHNGIHDINNKIIRTVGNPNERIEEDYLRMIRAIRFAVTLDFNLDFYVRMAISNNAHKILNISQERIFDEIKKVAKLDGRKFAKFIVMLKELKLLKHVFPKIYETCKFDHYFYHHPEGNVFNHTMCALSAIRGNKDILTNLAILWHDVGKIKCKTEDEFGVIHYYKHARKGVELIEDEIASHFRMSNDMKNSLIFLIKNHMKMHKFHEMRNSKKTKLIMNKDFNRLRNLIECDEKANFSYDYKKWVENDKEIERLKKKYKENKNFHERAKVANGHYIMNLREDIEPSPRLGFIIEDLNNFILDNELDVDEDRDEIDKFIFNW